MPSDVVTIAVSTGIGVSVIAGVLSGVCYVLVQGFARKRSRKPSLQWYCAVCGSYLRSRLNEEKVKIVICSACEERVCKQRCSKRNYAKQEWICYTCLKRPSIVQNIRNVFCLPYKNLNWMKNMVSNQSGQTENKLENAHAHSYHEKEYVRDFIEKLISTIIGGSVDEASISRVYNDKSYDSFIEKFHRDLSEAITNLSSVLQISMKNASFTEQTPSSAHTSLKLLIEKILREATRLPRFRKPVNHTVATEERTYEDLLATAILNKIKQRIEEIPSKVEREVEDDEVDYSYENYSSGLNNDQHNWYLQKPQIYETNSPVPVPMLVPNSLTSAKVLIGDKEVDDTSDLSDANSDDVNVNSQIQELIVDSAVKKILSEEETSFDSGVREDRDDYNEIITINWDDISENLEDVSLISAFSAEKDAEYLEKFSSLPTTLYRRSVTNSQQVPSSLGLEHSHIDNQIAQEPLKDPSRNKTDLSVFQGSYSQKDKEKWNHPVTIPNNPYSSENIQKRIETNQRYGRDYYTKQAGLPSGRTKPDENDNFSWTPYEGSLHRADPVAITDDEEETMKNNLDWNVNDQQPEDSSDLSIVQCYNVQNSKIYYEPSHDNKTKYEVQVNKKEIVSPELDNFQDNERTLEIQVNKKEIVAAELDFITYSNTNSNVDFGKNLVKEPIAAFNGNMDKESEKEYEAKVISSPKISNNLPSAPRKNEENQDNRTLFVSSKKSDNTWIKKIYSNPVVRNFALTNRDHVPWITDEGGSKTKNKSPEDERNNTVASSSGVKIVESITDNSVDLSESNNLEKDTNNHDKEELSATHNFSLEFSDSDWGKEESVTTYDNDCNELKERRLVANRLGEFSKAFPNLMKTRSVSTHQLKRNVRTLLSEDIEQKQVESTESYEGLISVKDLKKLFEKNEIVQQNKNKPVHSLTARSISKEVKQKLSNYDNN
ncbi:uncharacterized protein LOC135130174 isoform X2 [Zophobas morio]|uniref:uncharacterized protein LOC135130174 isoform X2 n=1 Tax=Zophobas morio TaxID=2755281 RepID=UPI0030836BFB